MDNQNLMCYSEIILNKYSNILSWVSYIDVKKITVWIRLVLQNNFGTFSLRSVAFFLVNFV